MNVVIAVDNIFCFQLENHQSNCCMKIQELLEADLRRRTTTLLREERVRQGSSSRAPDDEYFITSLENSEWDSDNILRKSKGGKIFVVITDLLDFKVYL